MAPPPPDIVDADYRRWGWRRTRVELQFVVGGILGALPGALAGFWLTTDWASEHAALTVAALCGAATAAVGWLGWSRLHPSRSDASPPALPALIRTSLDGQLAVVTPPAATTTLANWVAALAVLPLVGWLAVAHGVAERHAFALSAAGVALVAAAIPVGWWTGPRVAMFTDRLELRRGPGRQVVAWEDVSAGYLHRRKLVIQVRDPRAVATRGPVRRPRSRQLPVSAAHICAQEVLDAVETYRTDTAARVDIARPARPRVVEQRPD